MISSRPYLLRAFYDWITDNGLTPYVMIDATKPAVTVPENYVTDGKIVLNIAKTAIRNLSINKVWLTFSARFSGVNFDVQVPINAVMAIYAKENGRGYVFNESDEDDESSPPPSSGKPILKVIK